MESCACPSFVGRRSRGTLDLVGDEIRPVDGADQGGGRGRGEKQKKGEEKGQSCAVVDKGTNIFAGPTTDAGVHIHIYRRRRPSRRRQGQPEFTRILGRESRPPPARSTSEARRARASIYFVIDTFVAAAMRDKTRAESKRVSRVITITPRHYDART